MGLPANDNLVGTEPQTRFGQLVSCRLLGRVVEREDLPITQGLIGVGPMGTATGGIVDLVQQAATDQVFPQYCAVTPAQRPGRNGTSKLRPGRNGTSKLRPGRLGVSGDFADCTRRRRIVPRQRGDRGDLPGLKQRMTAPDLDFS